jgi:hypothetical protein
MLNRIAERLYTESRTSFSTFIDDITTGVGRPLVGEEISLIVNEYFFEIEANYERLGEE